MSIITRFLYKIKLFLERNTEEVGISLIIILVAISSFFLGKYSVLNEGSSFDKITFEKGGDSNVISSPNQAYSSGTSTTNNSGQVVASKTGKRYYLPWCAAAERISDKNKVYFASAEEAVKAGLTPASNCKGMSNK